MSKIIPSKIISPDTWLQVQDDRKNRRRGGTWHAAIIGTGVVCDLARKAARPDAAVEHDHPRTVRWAFGLDRVDCPACLTVLAARTAVARPTYELIGA